MLMVWIMTHSPIMDTSSQVRSLDRWMVIILSFHEEFHPLFFPVIFLVLSKSISYWSNSAWFQRTCHGPKINIFVINSKHTWKHTGKFLWYVLAYPHRYRTSHIFQTISHSHSSIPMSCTIESWHRAIFVSWIGRFLIDNHNIPILARASGSIPDFVS